MYSQLLIEDADSAAPLKLTLCYPDDADPARGFVSVLSPVGLALRYVTAGVHPEVFPVWMAAMPIVIFGAPAGAYISTRMPRTVLLRIIGVLCLVQFGATVMQVRPSAAQCAMTPSPRSS